MSKNKQIEKNLELSSKVAEYITEHPSILKNFPSGASYVVITLKDKPLNKLNLELIKDLRSKGQKVIKVEETADTSSPWNFSTQ